MILVVDLGTQTFRVTVLSADGAKHFEHAQPMISQVIGDLVEQDPLEWKAALFHALTKLSSEGQGILRQIRGIAACATLSGLVCLNAQGEPMGPAMLYADRRPSVSAERIALLPEFQATGWRAYAGDFLPQISYVRDYDPERYEESTVFLDATAYLNYLLTGHATLDVYTAYTCYANPTSNELPLGLFKALDIDPGKLGAMVRVGEAIGPLRPELLSHFGFQSPQVIAASYDSAAAYLGAGLSRPGEALDISGTVTSFGVLTEKRVTDPQQRILAIPSHDGRWIIRGSTALAGGVLEWARRELIGADFEAFDRMVLASPPGANGVLFLPYLAGARSPLWRPSATGVFFGLTAQSTRSDMARAVYEGICFSLRHITTIIETHGVEIGPILLGGGLAKNPVLNQIKADITGKRLIPLEDTELTTSGAAAIVARAVGIQRPDSKDTFLRYGSVIKPNASRAGIYKERFGCYRSIAEQLFPLNSTNVVPNTGAARCTNIADTII